MLMKWLAHGRGLVAAAVRYLLGKRDASGKTRAEVRVLRGDPALVASLGDALPFVWRYSSGVIAWAPEDQPSDAQIDALLDDFERAMAPGLDINRLAYTAVLHRDADGSCHVHILVARVDLQTGLSYNPAPPGWERTYDPLRDAWNHAQGWAAPDDPVRARAQSPGHRALVNAAAVRAAIQVEPDTKQLVTDYLLQRVLAGHITDRAGVCEALTDLGLQIPRLGADYLSVRDPDTGVRHRLKGALYAQHLDIDAIRQSAIADPASDRPGGTAVRGADPQAARAAREKFERAVERMAAINRAKYARREPPAAPTAEAAAAGDAAPDAAAAVSGPAAELDRLDAGPALGVAGVAAVAGASKADHREQRADLPGPGVAGLEHLSHPAGPAPVPAHQLTKEDQHAEIEEPDQRTRSEAVERARRHLAGAIAARRRAREAARRTDQALRGLGASMQRLRRAAGDLGAAIERQRLRVGRLAPWVIGTIQGPATADRRAPAVYRVTSEKHGLRIVDVGDGLIALGAGDQRAMARAAALATRLLDLRGWAGDEATATGSSSWLQALSVTSRRRVGASHDLASDIEPG